MEVKFFDRKTYTFVQTLNQRTKSKTLRALEALGQYGSNLGMPFSKALGRGLFELRIQAEHDVRIFYTFHKGSVMVLHGFIKKTQKTPLKELRRAIKKRISLD